MADSNIQIVGLPADFEISEDDARQLKIDDIIGSASLNLGYSTLRQALVQARVAAEERGNDVAVNALQLLVTVVALGLSDDPRAPFGRMASGHFPDGALWHTALPEDLSEAHVRALQVIITGVETPIMRARLADVLWCRVRPRNREYVHDAIVNYLDVARATFNPQSWTTSEKHFHRAYSMAASLGSQNPEVRRVLAVARNFLQQLDGVDILYYTERLITTILPSLSDLDEVRTLERRMENIAQGSSQVADFERARTYCDGAILLAKRISDRQCVKRLQLWRAETYITQSAARPTEMLRSFDLRMGQQALRRAGATRARLAEVAALLEEAQTVAVTEMNPIGTPFSVGALPQHVGTALSGLGKSDALWTLAGLGRLSAYDDIRASAEAMLSNHHFAFGFDTRHLSG